MSVSYLSSLPIGITMGCPASIGPELIVSFQRSRQPEDSRPVIVIGDSGVLKTISRLLGLPVDIRSWQPGLEVQPGCLNVYEVSRIEPQHHAFGNPTAETSRAMARYVETAIELCLAGRIRAMVTCPISKISLSQAGYDFPGHTEMLAQRTGAAEVAMMLTGTALRVVPATIHCSLAAVAGSLSSERIVRQIRLTEQALRTDFLIDAPRIGVAGLNPHAGESGLFGDEERLIIAPAVEKARRSCHPRSVISGPHPPDTVFYKARAGIFDAVIAMYHDQGLIPFKLLHFDDGVNVTLGLPLIRTSVDHGTAYDIAGRGVASIASLRAAFELADSMARNRSKNLIRNPSGPAHE